MRTWGVVKLFSAYLQPLLYIIRQYFLAYGEVLVRLLLQQIKRDLRTFDEQAAPRVRQRMNIKRSLNIQHPRFLARVNLQDAPELLDPL